MILDLLRDRTARTHERVERLVDLPSRLRSRDAYAGLLAKFFGLYAPLESRLGEVAMPADVGLPLAPRMKVPFLRGDLLALNLSPAAVEDLPRCPPPRPPSVSEALGWLYVTEGSTLGGQLVRREVGRALGLGPKTGCGFFSCYGDRVRGMWSEYRDAVSGYAARNPAAVPAIVAAAVEVFSRFEGWLAC